MAYTLIQTGSDLKSVNTDGVLSSALTLPDGVTLATNLIPRFARFKRYCVVVNTPNRPVTVDPDGVVRLLTPAAPGSAVALSAGASGTLSGTYLALQTFKLLDDDGNIVAESDYGPAMSAAVTIASKYLSASYPASSDEVDAVQLYRTTTDGDTYFPWTRLDGDSTSTTNQISDDAMGIVEGPFLGTAPDLTLICAWQGRLWGVDRTEIDNLRYTESGTMYGWYALNTIAIGKVGDDETGIVGLIPRRNVLGVGKRSEFSQISGTTRTNFNQSTRDGIGLSSQESVVIHKDIAYFLWRDGVYTWSDEGFKCISDGLVRTWFTTEDVFNRAMFWRSFASLDPTTLRYRLFLASAGNDEIDCWIEYDIMTGKWWGPHSTAAFTPTCALVVYGADQSLYPMIGSDEQYLSLDQDTRTDWTEGIAMRVVTRAHDLLEPELEKYFGELSVLNEKQTGGVLSVTPTVGNQDATAMNAWSHTMSVDRRRLGRLGRGRFATLELTNSEVGQDVVIYGYEIDPVHVIGRR